MKIGALPNCAHQFTLYKSALIAKFDAQEGMPIINVQTLLLTIWIGALSMYEATHVLHLIYVCRINGYLRIMAKILIQI